MIEAIDIVKTYNKGSRRENNVLDHASITFPDTGMVFIVGKSGIGKSTILNAIGGLIDYEGKIKYDNKSVNIEEYRRKNIGYIFQDFLLFDEMSVRDNIKVSLNISGIYDEKEITKRVNILLKAVGLNINAKRSAGALSLGQRQRVAIARALASNPKIILADEPTGNLDSVNSLNVMKILRKLSKNHLVIIVSHNVNLVHLFADRAFAIIDKKFTEIDPKKQDLDEAYVSNVINIATLNKKAIQDGNILFKIYTDDSTSKDEITLIRRGGKILVVGDNISLASKEDITLIQKMEDSTKKNDPLTSDIDSDIESIDLDFKETKSHQKFRDSKFYEKLTHMFSFSNIVSKKKFKVLHFTAMVIPLLIFMVINIGRGILQNTMGLVYNANLKAYDKNLVVAVNSTKKEVKVDKETLMTIVDDPSSHIIETQQELSLYNKSNGSYLFNGKNSLYGYIEKEFLDGSVLYLNLDSFSVLDSITSTIVPYDYVKPISFRNIDDYKTLIPALDRYHLNDDEILIDRYFFEHLSRNNVESFEFSSGDFYSNLKGSYVNIPYYSDIGEKFYKRMKIVDAPDTGLALMFMNKKTYQDMVKLGFDYHYWKTSALLESVDILPYSSLDESKYSLYSVDGNGKETRISKSDINPNLIKNLSEDAKNYLEIRQSLNVNRFAFGFASPSFLRKANIDQSTGVSSINELYSTAFYSVKDNIDPEKDVFVSDSETDYENALLSKCLATIIFSSTVDDSLEENAVTLPKELYDNIPSKRFTDLGGKIFPDGIDFSGSDTCKIGNGIFNRMRRANLKNIDLIQEDLSSGILKESVSLANIDTTAFLSDDVDKTIDYLNSKSEELGGLTFVRYDSALERLRDFYTGTVFRSITGIILSAAFVMVLILFLQNLAKVNKNKYRFGVLRCLGMPIPKIILDDSVDCFFDYMISVFVPVIVLSMILSATRLNYMGPLLIPYFLAMLLLMLLSCEIPLLITLLKKPYQILRNLN